MLIPRILKRAAVFLLPVLPLLAAAPAHAGDAPEALARAIQLFEHGDYLTAQETLVGIDRDKLTGTQQASRDDYLNRIQVAITLEEKALRDLEDAETAIVDGETGRARELLGVVIANEYAPQAIRRSAETKLHDLEDGPTGAGEHAHRSEIIQATTQGAQPPGAGSTMPSHARPADGRGVKTEESASATARDLTQAGHELLAEGRYDEAEQRYHEAVVAVPGFPEALDGLDRVRAHRRNASGGPGRSLADRIREDDAVNWQRTTTLYHDLERQIRELVAAERFDETRQLLVRARHLVHAGRQFADPVVKYENLRSEMENLGRNVAAAERIYNEREVARVRREIEARRSEKLREIEERRAQQVDLLMQQAMRHRKDGEFDAAISTLRQVVTIDRHNQPARWMMDILEDQQGLRRGREIREKFYVHSQGALNDVEEAKIPWWQDLNYPNDWPERISRKERRTPGRTGADGLLISALDRPIDVHFKREPFHEVIEHLADAQHVNLIVNWHDLKNAGVEPGAPIDLDLPNQISLKKALTEVLDQAGAGLVDLGFDVADGVISVATQRTLDRRTYPAVYPISDLLMDIPSFDDAPLMDLRRASQVNQGRRTNRRTVPWEANGDMDDESEPEPETQSKIRRLIELLQDTVAPDSWRDRGGTIGTIREINQQLVVTQNSAAQRQIGGLLDKLREQRAIQIAVEAIFVTVASHYLEELGMDLDIVLNTGNSGFDFLNDSGVAAVDPVLGSRLLLPRTFSRLGFTPNAPTLGIATTTAGAVAQPFTQPALVPFGRGGGGRQGTPIPILSSLTDFTDPSSLPSDIPGSFAGQTIGPALNIMGSFLDNIQVDFLIRATQADSRTTVLTAPRLVVFNGGSAWVAVTVQQNFVSQLNPVVAQGAVAQAPVTNTIDAGASLFVRATVTADRRYVMLLISPGVTRLLDLQNFAFSGGTGALAAFVQLPTLSAMQLQTMVSVPDGGTLLVGGQKLASETEVEAGVPILSKIPILKRAYSSRTTVKDEQTLLILIKPKILIHSEQEELAFPSFSQG